MTLNEGMKQMTCYTNTDFKTKKELKEAVASGKKIGCYQPGPFGGNEVQNGQIAVNGPHDPEAHRWYAKCDVKNGYIVKVK